MKQRDRRAEAGFCDHHYPQPDLGSGSMPVVDVWLCGCVAVWPCGRVAVYLSVAETTSPWMFCVYCMSVYPPIFITPH